MWQRTLLTEGLLPLIWDCLVTLLAASVEALKMILSRAAKGRMKMWLDISTAFLFANIVQPTVIELPGNFSLETGEPAYLSSTKLCTV